MGPDYTPPPADAPDSYLADRHRGLVDGATELSEWWKNLGDPTLDSLIQRSLQNNLDLREALARIREARARRVITGTQLLPTIDASGSFSRDQRSDEIANGEFGVRVANTYAVGLDASWEVDLWGRIRRINEAASAEIGLSVEDARDALVSVLAETALNYVELRNSQELIRIAQANIELQEQTVELTRNQFNANLVSQLDVSQARSNLESTRASLPPLKADARAARNRLAVLLGMFPGALEEELRSPAPIPSPASQVAVGIPADIIRQRPDIRRAERELAAETARIGIAEGDLYPRLSLLGSIGLQAEHSSDLLDGRAAAFRIAPSLTWNVFDRRRIRGNIEVADARQEQALLRYERSVLRALEETENAMVRFAYDQDRRDSLETAVAQARRAVELSEDQYRQGLVSFQSVLDSQRFLFGIESSLASTRASITTDLISLYKALGGGWECRDVVLTESPKEGSDP